MTEEEAIAISGVVKPEYHEAHQHGEISKNGEEEGRLCSLCGDIGFEKLLLLCKKCGFRLQHSYCSRLYPEINMEDWSCEWCLHEQHQQQKMDNIVAPPPVDDYEFRRKKKRKRQRSNSKVFEFLLEIADQSSAEAERYTKLQEAKLHGKTSTVCEEKAMKKRLSSSSFGYNTRKLNVDIGLESPTSTTSTRENSSVADAVISNGHLHKTSMAKNNSSKTALDRWRNLAVNKNKLGYRRYKLLADVHC